MVQQVVKTGVLLGTVLCPILFLLYINDIFMTDMEGKLLSFADDTSIVFSEMNVSWIRPVMDWMQFKNGWIMITLIVLLNKLKLYISPIQNLF